jgi:hypothetical protein
VVTAVSSSAKKRSTYIRATLKPLAMPMSKTITPARQAELERRTADWSARQGKSRPK